MKLTITVLIAVAWVSAACGSLVEEQSFDIQMYGVSQSADSAVGTATPDFQSYQLTEVAMISTDGATLTKLFDNEEEKIFRVIDRAQLIYSKAIDDLEGNSYSGVRLSFVAAVTGGNETYQELSYTMSSPTLILTQNFTIEKAKSLILAVKIRWADTIGDATMSEPSFDLSLD